MKSDNENLTFTDMCNEIILSGILKIDQAPAKLKLEYNREINTVRTLQRKLKDEGTTWTKLVKMAPPLVETYTDTNVLNPRKSPKNAGGQIRGQKKKVDIDDIEDRLATMIEDDTLEIPMVLGAISTTLRLFEFKKNHNIEVDATHEKNIQAITDAIDNIPPAPKVNKRN